MIELAIEIKLWRGSVRMVKDVNNLDPALTKISDAEPSRLGCRSLSLKGNVHVQEISQEIHDRAVHLSHDRVKDYPSI